MSRHGRRFILEAPSPEGVIRCLADRVEARALAEGRNPVVTITRAGNFYDPRYGDFEISREMLESMVRNFDAGVYGQRIALDVAHRPNEGAAGYFTRLFLDGNKLRGEVELTDYGREAIERKGYRYVSAEFVERFTDNESREEYGPTLLGAGLVVRPAIKRLDPVQLAEAGPGEPRTCLTNRVTRFLSEETATMWEQLLKRLREQLGNMGLAEAVIKQLVEACQNAGKNLGDDEAAAKALVESFETTGKQLAEQVGDKPVTLSIDTPQPAQPDAQAITDQVKKALDEQRQAEAEKARQLQETRDTKVKLFTETLGELQGLNEEQAKQFTEAAELITAEMSDDQVKKFAEHQKAMAEQMAASAQLAGMGWQGQGSTRITVDESNNVKQLQEEILGGLRGSYLHGTGALRLQEKVNPFVEKVLTEFDRIHAPRLQAERKLLAGGTTGVGDTNLPAGFQRTVIREALSDLRILELVQTLTDFQAQATTQIPYEERDTANVGDGVVYEGGSIPRAGISQRMDTAYVLPMKLAYLLSNEVIHFTRASQINWDAWARNVESNSRVMRELIARRIANHLQREADAYMAATVSAEDIAPQLDGATSEVKLANFPIVRPFQQYDLQGNTIGSEKNPMTVVVNGATIERYDGTGNQSAGTYYRITSLNLGKIQLVDESGSPVTPTASSACTVTYDRVTNVAKFDIDVPTDMAREKHLNGLVQAVGRQKAVMSQDRYVMPDFLLMSATLHNDITDAEQFARESKRDGTDTTAGGDLERVKNIGAWSTNAPGIDLGEERILMGQRGTLSYVVAKPWATGEPFEAVDANGLPTGQRQAYGEEYSAIHVPSPLRGRITSVLAYSASGR